MFTGEQGDDGIHAVKDAGSLVADTGGRPQAQVPDSLDDPQKAGKTRNVPNTGVK